MNEDLVKRSDVAKMLADNLGDYNHGRLSRMLSALQSQAGARDQALWLVWSNEHRAWWRPDRSGYTNDEANAGRYTFDEAQKICHKGGHARAWSTTEGPYEIMTPASETIHALKSAAPAPTQARLPDGYKVSASEKNPANLILSQDGAPMDDWLVVPGTMPHRFLSAFLPDATPDEGIPFRATINWGHGRTETVVGTIPDSAFHTPDGQCAHEEGDSEYGGRGKCVKCGSPWHQVCPNPAQAVPEQPTLARWVQLNCMQDEFIKGRRLEEFAAQLDAQRGGKS